jgi:hypothetical protein
MALSGYRDMAVVPGRCLSTLLIHSGGITNCLVAHEAWRQNQTGEHSTCTLSCCRIAISR